MMVLTLSSLPSCTDGNDWSADSNYAHLFGIGDMSIEAYDTYADLTFSLVRGASSYVIEYSTDSLYDGISGQNSVMVTAPSTPYKIENLVGETRYYLRLKAIGEGINESRWVYYRTGSGKGYFTTKAEQIFNEVTSADYDDANIHVSWRPGSEVTRITISDNAEEPTVQEFTLTDADKSAAEYFFHNLKATTTYTITIYNGDVKRGQLNVTTTASIPSADYKYFLGSDVKVIDQDLMNSISSEAQAAADDPTNYSVTIAIPADVTIDMHGTAEDGSSTNIKIPDGMSVTFFGMAGGAKPVLNMSKCVNIQGSHAFVRFENVVITDGGCQYLINQSASCTLGDLSFTDCEVRNLSRSLVRLQGSEAMSIDALNIDNCLVDNQGSGSYALIYYNNAAYSVNSVNISKSTFSNILHSVMDFRNAHTNSVTFSDCTFYNIIGAGRYLIDAQNVNPAPAIIMTNCIFAKTNTDTSKGIRSEGSEVESTNSYFTNDFVLSSNKFTVDQEFSGSSDDLFKDPAALDFTLKTSLGAGDPRWYPTD